MTRKALVVAMLAALAWCVPASANVLPLKTAKQVARRLAAKQIRTRQILSVHIFNARRVGPREIRFAYDDRSASNVFCTSVIVVKLKSRNSNTAVGSFQSNSTVCRGIPADALAYEAAIRNAGRAVASQKGTVAASINSLARSSRSCRTLRVPANRRAQVALFERSATTTAIYGPIDSQLQSFVNSLASVRSSDGVLVAGAAGWSDLLEVYRSLPTFRPGLCRALKRWAAAGWIAPAAPADYAALKALDARARRDQLAIVKASAHLADLGVFPRTAVAYTPPGLVALSTGLKVG